MYFFEEQDFPTHYGSPKKFNTGHPKKFHRPKPIYREPRRKAYKGSRDGKYAGSICSVKELVVNAPFSTPLQSLPKASTKLLTKVVATPKTEPSNTLLVDAVAEFTNSPRGRQHHDWLRSVTGSPATPQLIQRALQTINDTLPTIRLIFSEPSSQLGLCPGCNQLIEKCGGCSHMVCPCGQDFQWFNVIKLTRSRLLANLLSSEPGYTTLMRGSVTCRACRLPYFLPSPSSSSPSSSSPSSSSPPASPHIRCGMCRKHFCVACGSGLTYNKRRSSYHCRSHGRLPNASTVTLTLQKVLESLQIRARECVRAVCEDKTVAVSQAA